MGIRYCVVTPSLGKLLWGQAFQFFFFFGFGFGFLVHIVQLQYRELGLGPAFQFSLRQFSLNTNKMF